MSRVGAAGAAAALWLGCLLGGSWWLACGGAAVLLAAATCGAGPWPGRTTRSATRYGVAVVALVLVGAGLAGGRTTMRDASWPARLTADGPADLSAVVVTESRRGPYGSWAVARVDRVGDVRVRSRVLIRLDRPVDLGSRLELRARVRPLRPGGFATHLGKLGVSGEIRAGPGADIRPADGALVRSTGVVRDRLHRRAAVVLGADRGSVLTGLVTGDARGRTPATTDLLRAGGLSHLVVVSGRHTALFVGAVLLLGRSLGLGFRGARILTLGSLGWFVFLVRWQPSVLRAGLVAAVVLVADLVGRDRDGVHLLAMAVLLLLLVDPLLAGQLGFALSVTATAGVLVLAPRVAARLAGPRWWRLGVATAVGAQAGVAPVLFAADLPLPPGAVVANLAAAPAAAVGQALGSLAALLALVRPTLADVPLRLGGTAVDVILWAAEVASRVLPAAPTVPRVLIAVLLGGAVVVVGRRTVRAGVPRWAAPPVRGTVAILVVVVVVVWPAGDAPDVDVLTVTMLDVGQGDAVLVTAPGPDGTRRMLVDAGPDPEGAARLLLAQGVRRVDVLVVTHDHADHAGGAVGVLRHLRVGTVAVGDVSGGDPRAGGDDDNDERDADRAGGDAVGHARQRNVPVVTLRRGDRFRLGAGAVDVLWPPSALPAEAGENERSVVLRVSTGDGSVLLTGDVEVLGQRALLREDRKLLDVDVVKVPHHGGATNAAGFLAATRPQLALVSVGRDNDYGHPASATLTAIRGVPVLRTDRDGTVTVALNRDGPPRLVGDG